jgi:hypothetical protein
MPVRIKLRRRLKVPREYIYSFKVIRARVIMLTVAVRKNIATKIRHSFGPADKIERDFIVFCKIFL